jgi:hypothetical protein
MGGILLPFFILCKVLLLLGRGSVLVCIIAAPPLPLLVESILQHRQPLWGIVTDKIR